MMLKLLWSLVFVAVLVRISYTDLKYRVIGKWETGILLGLGCFCYFVPLWGGWCGGILSGLFLAGLVELVNLVCFRLKGIGGGDVRLLFVMGFVLGIDRGLWALFMALVMALGVMVFTGHNSTLDRNRIPLGPFLAVGFCVQLGNLLFLN